MSTALVITSSALGAASVSSQLVEETVARLRSHDPALRVIARDLGRDPVPHLTTDPATALRGGEPSNEAQAAARTLSDGLIAELKAADTIIIGAPMYNFGMPSTLKAWFDHVLRAASRSATARAALRAFSRASALLSSRAAAASTARDRRR
jgi:FMN-dependent NADH-azoreductase